jgi:hypothetical protein
MSVGPIVLFEGVLPLLGLPGLIHSVPTPCRGHQNGSLM